MSSSTSFFVGQKITFGRANGEKTPGTVMKINPKSLKIRQDEARGGHPVGMLWNVPPSLVYPLAADAAPIPFPSRHARARNPVSAGTRMADKGITVGDRVSFIIKGRTITGTVVRINVKSATVQNCDDGSPGWRVSPGLITPASGATVAPTVPSLPANLRVGTTVQYTGFVWGKGQSPVMGVITLLDPAKGEVEVYSSTNTRNTVRIPAKDIIGVLTVPRTPDTIKSDFLAVYGDLSPENLTCDGELSRAQVNRRAAELNRALRALTIENGGRTITEAEAYDSLRRSGK